eukprot:CAMPEP_0183335696 /NCGR_PEP_ID=MMETSP0164_2-20130417/3917_1 /TAXON_ID=221442 /ORGANISM="Coccolithus pelagicus ssp braarudi, Strain PLY182g" /LENGTH=98 /DNA_ID=CAMNT_0025505101 /DNA_START=252 /DNA_END=546 /DNA_ORIENTATION=+
MAAMEAKRKLRPSGKSRVYVRCGSKGGRGIVLMIAIVVVIIVSGVVVAIAAIAPVEVRRVSQLPSAWPGSRYDHGEILCTTMNSPNQIDQYSKPSRTR